MKFDIITIFPRIFDSYLNESLLKRAQKRGIIKVNTLNLRDFTDDKHKKIDDKPFGGGPGMVIKVEPVYKAVQFLKSKIFSRGGFLPSRQAGTLGGENKKLKTRTVLFSTRGKKLDMKIAKRLSKYDQLILICGRYEGVDERVAKYVADEEISAGDYVLSGGELIAMILIESVSRFLPGFLGKNESLEEIKGSYPVYTRPEVFSLDEKSSGAQMGRGSDRKRRRKLPVPKVLLSGDHKKIREWRGRSGSS